QERRDDEASVVMYPAGGPQLAHAGVDHGVAGAPLLPGLEPARVRAPWEVLELPIKRLGDRVGVLDEQVIGKLPPGELPQIALGAGRVEDGMPDLHGADLAEVQMRRQARGAVVIGAVAFRAVLAYRRFRERSEPGARGFFAGRPG